MDKARPHVFTIACDAPFLDILATEILKGFPGDISYPDLGELLVLVPTRRAARELQFKLLAQSKLNGLVLPSIRPIGDVDEDILEIVDADSRLPNAISAIGRQFVIVGLIDKWVAENQHLQLATEISNSPQQAQSLAISLAELIDSLETEEISLDRLPDAYFIDLADHREAILGLLDLIRINLPAKLHEDGLMGAKERRSRLIRLEVQRLIDNPPKGPIIAAGSTGTIPATRELLKAISKLENGAVILPGLDQGMDDVGWFNVTPQHPQYALKQLVEFLDVERKEITTLGRKAGNRAWVASELMRPSDVADKWQHALNGQRELMIGGLADVSLLVVRDKNEEASIIALRMRRALETLSGDIALVTPDRDLARRVKAALLRWDIQIDDSAGEPLIRFGAASLLALLMDAVGADFNAPSLCALFAHPLSRFGLERKQFQRAAQNIDLVLFRDQPMGPGLGGLQNAYERAVDTRGKSRRHPLVANLSEGDWQDMGDCVGRIVDSLAPLSASGIASFGLHLEVLLNVARDIAGEALWAGAELETLETLLTTLQQESHYFPPCGFNRAASAIRQQLSSTPFRQRTDGGTRLSILGLLEARLMGPDTIILGGLNEGIWPRQPDAGPWLNRPMRELFEMPQPERQIGQMAHDFVQAFGATHVYLTYSRRDGMTPAIPSRWILRLQTIMKAVGLGFNELPVEPWADWAAALDEAPKTMPLRIPLPTPPVASRPKRLSVTRIEKLIRDPYAIYAQSVLGLEPLADVSAKPNAALRGTLYHAAIGDFFMQHSEHMPSDALDRLIAVGRKQFEPYSDTPEIAGFWWARFKRIALWIVENEKGLRADALKIAVEVYGVLDLQIGDAKFQLNARADRIDIHGDGTAHIIDFKSGSPPSGKAVKAGFSPQLTLEAAMLEQGAFAGLGRHETRDFTYVKISGGIPPGEIKNLDLIGMDEARKHLASLTTLLLKYQEARQAYVPRFGMQREDDVSEFDHLSRYWEWVLAGDLP
jgi:ATP-dependent helicase/nuclease subunit B